MSETERERERERERRREREWESGRERYTDKFIPCRNIIRILSTVTLTITSQPLRSMNSKLVKPWAIFYNYPK